MTTSRAPRSAVLLSSLLCGSFAALAAGSACAQAITQSDLSRRVELDIPAQPLANALMQFSAQTGLDLSVSTDLVEGKQAAEIKGTYTTGDALRALLRGSDLEFVASEGGVVAIKSLRPSTESAASGEPQGAQKAPEQQPTSSTVLEEILVSANRREQSLQDVSASVTAFSTADIQRKGFDSFSDFAGSVPGLTLNESVRNRGSFNIRGVALNVTGANTQDPVSIYINDTPVSDTYGAIVVPDLRLFDVARIEVLRGPQGTLFGSGSLGGTVRIITNQPNATKTEAGARVDFGHTQGGALRQRYDGMVNLPLIDDKLAVRAVGYYRDEEGWVKNTILGTKNGSEDWGGRLSMLWTPNGAFSLKAEVIHQDSDPEDGDSWNPALGKFRKASHIAEGRKAELTNYSLTAAYDFADFATLSSITTYQESKSASLGDLGDVFGVGLPLIVNSHPWDAEFFVQELRLVSTTRSRLEWVAGAFFIDRETNVDFLQEVPGLDALRGGAIGSDAYFDTFIGIESQELAVYGDLTFSVTDALKLNAGLRKFRTESSYAEPHRRLLNMSTLTYTSTSFKNEGEDSDYTWRTGLSYELSGDAMVYGSLSKGYRVGQVNPNNGPSPVDPDDIVIPEGYKADSTLNYELGAKTSWLERRLIANLALYYIDWSDIQIDGQRLSDRRNFITNAGEARSRGVELELNARPSDGLTLYTSLTFQDAEVTDVPTDIVVPAAVGDVLPGLVDFKWSGGFEYRWDLGANQLYVRADGQYVESSPNGLRGNGTNRNYAVNESYENVDAAIGMVTRWGEVALYGENLTNNDSYILDRGGASINPINTLRPRTAGVRVNVKY